MSDGLVVLSRDAKQKLGAEIRHLVITAGDRLQKLADACCQPDRSENIKLAALAFEQSMASLEQLESIQFEKAALGLSTFGGHIGRMFVTCCEPSRTPLYHQILQRLGRAHELLVQLDGQGH